jgi:hypothetical protein
VALTKIICPECRAALKSPSGFSPGQSVSCPKCETEFTVDEQANMVVADDEDFEQPNKKQGKESSYKNSWMRYAVLGVLVCVLGVLGYMLYDTKMKENRAARNGGASGTDDDEATPVEPRVVHIPPGTKVPVQMPVSGAGGAGGKVEPKGNGGKAGSLVEEFQKKLVGQWVRAKSETIEYKADGTFVYTASDPKQPTVTIAGRWKLISAERDPDLANEHALHLEWTPEGKPAVKGTMGFRQDQTIQHPLLDRLMKGERVEGDFAKK